LECGFILGFCGNALSRRFPLQIPKSCAILDTLPKKWVKRCANDPDILTSESRGENLHGAVSLPEAG